MIKYVSLEKVKQKIRHISSTRGISLQTTKALVESIQKLPYTTEAELTATIESSDNQSVLPSKWIKTKLDCGVVYYKCFNCNYGVTEDEMNAFDFCPKCGAKNGERK